MDKLEHIVKYKKINDNLYTSGQPNIAQLNQLKAQGIELVINLALPDSDLAEPDEASLLKRQGIEYLPLPINFNQPCVKKFREFQTRLTQSKSKKVLVHCAYNMRVCAFIYLYRVLDGQDACQAKLDRNEI